jgi:hypothetical protein
VTVSKRFVTCEMSTSGASARALALSRAEVRVA